MNNPLRAFCNDIIQLGEPVSFSGEYSAGIPRVEPWFGKNYVGVSLNHVVSIDSIWIRSYYAVAAGGMINIANAGCEVSIPKKMIRPKNLDFNNFIQPSEKHIWKVTKKRKQKSVGIITSIRDLYVDVRLF